MKCLQEGSLQAPCHGLDPACEGSTRAGEEVITVPDAKMPARDGAGIRDDNDQYQWR